MQTLISHASLEALESYSLNRPGARAEETEEHLLVCECCRVALTGIDEEIRIMRLALS